MAQENIIIRQATKNDVPTLVRLNHALFLEDAGQRDPFMDLDWPLKEGEAYFNKHMLSPKSIALLAEIDGKTVGYLIGYLRGVSTLRPIQMAELESMFVEKVYRSQTIGEQLVQSFLIWAEKHGAERVSVTAYTANEGAVSFYERQGFLSKSTTLEIGL